MPLVTVSGGQDSRCVTGKVARPLVAESGGQDSRCLTGKGESDVLLPCLLSRSQGGKILGVLQGRRVGCASAMPLVTESGCQDSRCPTGKVNRICFCHASCRKVSGARFQVKCREGGSSVLLPCLFSRSEGGKIMGVKQGR